MEQNSIPYQQGEFDGLCAVYSTINAIRLTLAHKRPLTYKQCQTLFYEAIAFMEDKGKLSTTITAGTNFIFWFTIQNHLCKIASEITQTTIKIERPFKTSKGVYLQQLKTQLLEYNSKNLICLAALAGYYKHYTVIQSTSAHRIKLFDSYNYHWINWNNIRTSSKAGNELHIFRPSSLTMLGVID